MIKLTFTSTPPITELLKEQDLQDLFVNSLYDRGLDSVVRLQERFSAVLQPGAREDVGASGRAAQNISTKWNKGEWTIEEGNITRANRIIREGLPPGSKVPIEKLRQWAADKGIKLYYHETDYETGVRRSKRTPNVVLDKLVSQNGTPFSRSRWFGGVGLKPESSMKPSEIALRGLYALRYALYRYGTQRTTSNWMKLFPKGSGRFNYPDYVFKKDNQKITQIIQDLGLEIAEDMGMSLLGGKNE